MQCRVPALAWSTKKKDTPQVLRSSLKILVSLCEVSVCFQMALLVLTAILSLANTLRIKSIFNSVAVVFGMGFFFYNKQTSFDGFLVYCEMNGVT